MTTKRNNGDDEIMRASEFAKRSPKTADNLHLREMPSFVFGIPDHPLPVEWHGFVRSRVEKLVPLTGYKLDEKRNLLAWMTNQLIVYRNRGACVADTRAWGDPGAKLRSQLWDAVCDAKLAIKCVGSEQAKKLTRYYATEKLIRLRKRWTLKDLVNVDLERNSERDAPTKHGLVFVWLGPIDPATGKPRSTKQGRKAVALKHFCTEMGLGFVRRDEDIVEAFNSNVTDHTWKFTVTDPETGATSTSPLNPCLRLFHCGQFHRAMRYYSWSGLSGQSLSKEERKTILIDGEPVTELDFSASVLRIIYRFAPLNPKGDLYRPERVLPGSYRNASEEDRQKLRAFVKDATLRCLNVTSRGKAHSSVGKLLRESEHRAYLHSVLREVEQTDIKGIVGRIVDAHARLVTKYKAKGWRPHADGCEPFFTQIGIDTMTTETHIMKMLLLRFTKAKKPALMIHDAVVCKRSDARFARRAMIAAYQWVLTTDSVPVIKREF